MANSFSIVVLPGDGIGPEVTAEATKALRAVGDLFGHRFMLEERLAGGVAIDREGTPISDDTMARCAAADAVLLGAVGGPKWDDPGAAARPEQALFRLRKDLGLFANLRPVRPYPPLRDTSPLRPERLAGVDLLIVRELTGGLYYSKPQGITDTPAGRQAVDTMAYGEGEIERALRAGFAAARGRRKRLTSVDKANVLATSRLWRDVATRLAPEYPDVTLEHLLVDTAAMRLVTSPASFDVLATENTFGDILSDEAGVLAGSLGLLPSASLGADGRKGLYEPVHGTAPDIAGRGLANPIGAILSAALLLRHSLGLEREAAAVEDAVARALDNGLRTADLTGDRSQAISTSAMGDAICARLAAAS